MENEKPKTPIDFLTGSLLGDLLALICVIAAFVIALTGALHHSDQWGLYVLLFFAASESYYARLNIRKHNRQNHGDG
jgi:hypothetical protein